MVARVGIVGAGISGLVCAQRLLSLEPSLNISVFEWGRGPGGRTARRRVTVGGAELSFDHAAPFFEVGRAPVVRDHLAPEWESAGYAARWEAAGDSIWVGTPTSHTICNGIANDLAKSGCTMLYGRHVRSARHDSDANVWRVLASNRQENSKSEDHVFDALVLSDKLLLLPNPYSILPQSEWGSLALPTSLNSTATVVLMLALERPSGSASLPAVLTTSVHAPLERIVHDSAKPGRQEQPPLDLWVAHSTQEYALSHLDGDDPPGLDDVEAVLEEMREAALATFASAESAAAACRDEASGEEAPADARVAFASVFAWDHAQPVPGSQLSSTHLLDAARRAGVCGDFFAGGSGCVGVEAAAQSGLALAEALLPVLRDGGGRVALS